MDRDHLDLFKYNKLVEHFHKESDRSAAIVLASFLEVCLEKYLMSFMIDDSQVQKIFDDHGPLSSLSACIDCAYAFGLIDVKTKQDLTFIRKIRNHFAHHPDVASFADSPVSDWCKELSFSKSSDETKPKSQFLIAVGLIIGQLHNDMLRRRVVKNNQGQPPH
jgi:DNA-binding MltR family transcriptional regulator